MAREKLTRVTVRIPAYTAKRIDLLKAQHPMVSKAGIVRLAIAEFLCRELRPE